MSTIYPASAQIIEIATVGLTVSIAALGMTLCAGASLWLVDEWIIPTIKRMKRL